MTWHANRIFVNATPASLARLRAEPALVGHVYLLTGSLPASWQPEAGEVRLPEGGLVVVKEVAAAEDPAEHAALLAAFGEATPTEERWHPWYGRHEFVPWQALHGPSEIDVIAGAEFDEIVEGERPPDAFLRFLKQIHLTSEAPVTYYACRTWGGSIELEYACVFADEERVYSHLSSEGTVEISRSGRRVRLEEVLPLALAHHGVHLPTPYFAPHTRGFDWTPHASG